MRFIVALLVVISASSAGAQTLFDGSSPKAVRESIHVMGKEADGQVRGKTFHQLLAAIQKIDKSIALKYLPVEGKPYDPKTANAAKEKEFRTMVDGKTRDEILATAAGLP